MLSRETRDPFPVPRRRKRFEHEWILEAFVVHFLQPRFWSAYGHLSDCRTPCALRCLSLVARMLRNNLAGHPRTMG
jgi:hypothetical protein